MWAEDGGSRVALIFGPVPVVDGICDCGLLIDETGHVDGLVHETNQLSDIVSDGDTCLVHSR